MKTKKKVLVFIVAYNAETTISSVLDRIRIDRETYDVDILLIDDASKDDTFHIGLDRKAESTWPLIVLTNPDRQGYGGNQKIGYHYAIEQDYDIVVLLHGDGQYAPEELENLVAPIAAGEADAVFGSRMMDKGGALKGGMPLYKFLGNKFLSSLQNFLLGTAFTEFHSGYRAYAVFVLENIPFEYNTDDFHFDTEIIIQVLAGKYLIKEVPIPTYYGDEICHVNGIPYAVNVIMSTLRYRLHGMGICYLYNFDVKSLDPHYDIKLGYPSSHTVAIEAVPKGSCVLDIACGPDGLVAAELLKKECTVIGIDKNPSESEFFSAYHQLDLNHDKLPESTTDTDTVLMLDAIEHLTDPEKFLLQLRRQLDPTRALIIITTPNIGFIATRLMLLMGQFNYGKTGILDKTHTRLFTFSSLKRLLEQCGFTIDTMTGIPAPFPKAIGDNLISKFLLTANMAFIKIWKRLFCLIFIIARTHPTLESLATLTLEHSRNKIQNR